MEKYLSVEEIRDIVKNDSPKYYCLENAEGNLIVPYNSVEPSNEKHIEKILKLLDSGRSIPEGVYYVVCCNNFKRTSVRTKLAYKKGTGDGVAEEITTEAEGKKRGAGFQGAPQYSMMELMRIHGELGELRARCRYLEDHIDQQNATIEELEDELAAWESKHPEGMDGMSEGAEGEKMMNAKVLDIVDRLSDKIFEVAPAANGSASAPATEAAPATMQEKKAPAKITYDGLLGLLRANPELVERLSNDLTPPASDAANASTNEGEGQGS